MTAEEQRAFGMKLVQMGCSAFKFFFCISALGWSDAKTAFDHYYHGDKDAFLDLALKAIAHKNISTRFYTHFTPEEVAFFYKDSPLMAGPGDDNCLFHF